MLTGTVASRSRSTNDDVALDRLADLPAERHAVRLKALTPVAPVDAAEITRLHGKTRTWVYDHAGELGAGRLGSGPRQRLAFSPGRPHDAPQRGGAPAANSTGPRPRLGSEWAAKARYAPTSPPRDRLLRRKSLTGAGFPQSGRPDLNRGPHRPELWAKSAGARRVPANRCVPVRVHPLLDRRFCGRFLGFRQGDRLPGK
jgi:hypothetical protein